MQEQFVQENIIKCYHFNKNNHGLKNGIVRSRDRTDSLRCLVVLYYVNVLRFSFFIFISKVIC
jgi:hypothetical protein